MLIRPTNLELTDRWILEQRPSKAAADPWKPHAFFVEAERMANGVIEDVATLFLTNRECPFRCLMCDLWKFTTERRVPDGAIPAQIEYALAHLPNAPHAKLYNAGNFFDAQAIPPGDHNRIKQLLRSFQTVIVECHPLLVGPRCLAFRDGLTPALEVAMGLETVHPDVLPRLNKRMTLDDFARAAKFLTTNDIAVRAFILLRPPFLDEDEGVEWAKRSIDFAFGVDVECCCIIPTRGGNGALERLAERGEFQPPRLESLENVLEYGLALGQGRVFADLWDIEKVFPCTDCGPRRAARLLTMNRTQTVPPSVVCDCRDGKGDGHVY
jgi:radical SAM enzyme (TIGR01210 family)